MGRRIFMKCNICGAEFGGSICPVCGTPTGAAGQRQSVYASDTAKPICTQPAAKSRKQFYNKWWLWLIIIIISVSVIAVLGKMNTNIDCDTSSSASDTDSRVKDTASRDGSSEVASY